MFPVHIELTTSFQSFKKPIPCFWRRARSRGTRMRSLRTSSRSSSGVAQGLAEDLAASAEGLGASAGHSEQRAQTYMHASGVHQQPYAIAMHVSLHGLALRASLDVCTGELCAWYAAWC